MLIAVMNESSRVARDDCRMMTSAIDYQMHSDVAPAWGRLPPKTYFANRDAWVPGSHRALLVDAIPEAPDALGYHTELADGSTELRIGVGVILDGGSVLQGAQSVSAVLSHEVIELFLDTFVNWWAEAPDGYEYPLEGCDAVQGDVYNAAPAAISVSNFLLPSWFDPLGRAPYDHLGMLHRPFSLARGGYTVRRKRGTGTTEIFGDRPHWKKSLRGVRRAA